MSFTLLGYHNPFGYYPSRVLPVGCFDGDSRIWVVATDSRMEVDSVDVPISSPVKDFDFNRSGLVAVRSGHFEAYDFAECAAFFSSFLSDPTVAIENPYARLDFAKTTRDPTLILAELTHCVLHMAWEVPWAVQEWYERERELLADLPTVANMLGVNHESVMSTLETQPRRKHSSATDIIYVDSTVVISPRLRLKVANLIARDILVYGILDGTAQAKRVRVAEGGRCGSIQEIVDEVPRWFEMNPRHPSLRRHTVPGPGPSILRDE
jgi:hypothetical protein